jgi:hypothetical protein
LKSGDIMGCFASARPPTLPPGKWYLKLLRDCDTFDKAAIYAMGCAHKIGVPWGIVCRDGQYCDMSCAGIDFAEKYAGLHGLEALPAKWSVDPDES